MGNGILAEKGVLLMNNSTPAQPMSRVGRVFLGSYLILLNIGALIALFVVWAGSSQLIPNLPTIPQEIRYLLIALIGGTLGTSVTVLTSFATFVGQRSLVASWGWWYVVRPFIGMTLGLLVYAAIRGGILKVSSDVDVLNPFAVTALSAIAGLYSKQLVDKLKTFANTQLAMKA